MTPPPPPRVLHQISLPQNITPLHPAPRDVQTRPSAANLHRQRSGQNLVLDEVGEVRDGAHQKRQVQVAGAHLQVTSHLLSHVNLTDRPGQPVSADVLQYTLYLSTTVASRSVLQLQEQATEVTGNRYGTRGKL